MRQTLIYFLSILTLLSCNSKPSKDETRISKLTHLIGQFKDVKLDTLNVFSHYDPDSIGFKFLGTEIDSTDIKYFPDNIKEQYTVGNKSYACVRFNIDSTTIGLIARTPSEYVSSSIKLFVVDKRTDKIVEQIELAESIGDAGDVLEKQSWLFFDNDKKLNSLIWEMQSHDNSVENDKDTTQTTDNKYFQLIYKKQKFDTLKMTNESLKNKFIKQLK
jgi:hypothetical protein